MPDSFTLADLASLRDENRTCYVENCLYAGQIAVLHGPPMVGKSYLLGQLSVCIANGTDWGNGRLLIPKPRNVLYVQTEGSRFDLAERVNPVFALMPGALENFLAWLPRRLDLRDGDELPALRSLIEQTEADVVVIDSLSSGSSGDIAKKEVASAIEVNLRDMMRRREEELAFIVIHHDHRTKFDTATGNPIDEKGNTFAGSYVIDAMADQRWWLGKTENQHGVEYKFHQIKHRGRRHIIDPFSMTLDEDTGILVPDAAGLGDISIQIRIWMRPKGFVTKEMFREWCEGKGFKRASRYRHIGLLMKSGQVVEVVEDGKAGYQWVNL